MNKIKKNDEVIVIAGKDKGKKAKVLQVIPDKKQVLLEKINIVKRHTKPGGGQLGGIIEKEKPIDWSNVMVVCKYCKKASDITFAVADNKKFRKCKKCSELIDK